MNGINHKIALLVFLSTMGTVFHVFAAGEAVGASSVPSTSPVQTSKDSQPDPGSETEGSKGKINFFATMIDNSQRKISQGILSMSRSIDAFFSNDRMMDESSGSYGCIRSGVFFEEGGNVDYSNGVCLKIDLPNTERRWKLFIESSGTQEEEQQAEAGVTAEQPVTAVEDTTSFAGFRYVAKEELLRYLNFDIGVKTRLPPDPFVRWRFRRTWVPGDWLYRLTESLYYYNSTQGGFLSRLDLERPLTESWYVRSTSSADYRDTDSQFYLTQVFGIYRRVGKRHALNLELIAGGGTQPGARLEYYVYRFRYRVNVWREWFFVEASPQVLYERTTHFDNVVGILLSAEAVFGNF